MKKDNINMVAELGSLNQLNHLSLRDNMRADMYHSLLQGKEIVRRVAMWYESYYYYVCISPQQISRGFRFR